MQEGGRECVLNICEQMQGSTGYHGAKTKGLYMCGVAPHAEDIPGRSRQGTTPGNDVADLQNEQVVYAPDDNYRNPSREAKHQQELLKTASITCKHWLGKSTESEMCNQVPRVQKNLASISPFSGLPNYSKNFYLSWCCLGVP